MPVDPVCTLYCPDHHDLIQKIIRTVHPIDMDDVREQAHTALLTLSPTSSPRVCRATSMPSIPQPQRTLPQAPLMHSRRFRKFKMTVNPAVASSPISVQANYSTSPRRDTTVNERHQGFDCLLVLSTSTSTPHTF